VSVTKFRGKQYVSIREYYEKDGKMLPGKRGINLTPEQFKLFVSLGDKIGELLDDDDGVADET